MRGMFGEQAASLIEKSNEKFASSNYSETTNDGIFVYPDYLAPINFDHTNISMHQGWSIDEEKINHLHTIYGDKQVCLPTQWYSSDISQSNVPSKGIALFTVSPLIVKISYTLFWIKTHMYEKHLWEKNKIDMQHLIDLDHPYSKEFIELQSPNKFQNWKYLAYKLKNLDANGNPDLRRYMSREFNSYKKGNITLFSASSDWFRFDIGNAIHGDQTNLPLLEEYLGIDIDRQKINEYAEKNLELINNVTGITVSDLQQEFWFDKLYDACKSSLEN
jgi:hypothetical protein